ncbi:MAG: TonB-dependent receptor, partial [Burkholderiales bacterium]|nr:TonB-dependent receptor [Burkholderiales bacterium]
VALFSNFQRQRIGTTRDDSVKQSSVGIYGENATQWLEKFRTVAGLRYDWYNFDVNSSLAVNSGKTSDGIVSPKLNLIFGPWAQTEFFVNWGQGFHSNDARGTVIRVDPATGLPADRVTPLVKSRGQEVGIRTQIIPGLQSSLTFWELKLDSELLFIGDAGTTEASRPSKREGIEWTNHYVHESGWLVDAQLSASRARFADSDPAGSHIPGSVNRVASLGVTYDPGAHWFGGVQFRYFGPRPLIEDNSVRSRSTGLWYLRGGYRFDKTWTVRLDVFNLFNRKQSDVDYYYPSCIRSDGPGCSAAGGVDDIHFHPVESRSARVSVTARF